MDKDTLRQEAALLLEAERRCRKLYAENPDSTAYRQALAEVQTLTDRVKRIHAALPELADKAYFWCTPFSPSDPKADGTFSLPGGTYVESDPLQSTNVSGMWEFHTKPYRIDYSYLSLDLTNRTYIPIYINKKAIKLHFNAPMVRRIIYNVSVTTAQQMPAVDLRRGKEDTVDLWQSYDEAAEAKKKEYEEYLKEHNEKWDRFEKISHGSLYTNEERWTMGQMDTSDYIREDVWREFGTIEKSRKMREDLDRMRLQAQNATQDMLRRQQEARLKSLETISTVHIHEVAHLVCYGDEILAIFLHRTDEFVDEYIYPAAIDGPVSVDMLTSLRYRTARSLASRIPSPIPVIRHLARTYDAVLPLFSPLSVCPKGCPEDLWRLWGNLRLR